MKICEETTEKQKDNHIIDLLSIKFV